MAEGDEVLPFMSLKDFEERGIATNPNWSGLEALQAVACLASEKIEAQKKRKAVEGNGYWSRLAASNGYERGGSSRRSNDSRARRLPRFPDTNFGYCCSVSERKQGFNKVAPRDKLIGDAMKARILDWEDDCDGEEWRAARHTNENQKRERCVNRRSDDSEEKNSRPNKKVKKERFIVPTETPDLPQEYREKIERLNGSNINLVIQKCLFSTDLSHHHNRLSIPLNQIMSLANFLNDDERIDINGGNHRYVKFIEPALDDKESIITLTRWPKLGTKTDEKKSETKSKKREKLKTDDKKKDKFSYVLIREWNNVKERNKLELGDLIQLWSFRTPDDKLCLALVLLGKGGQVDGRSNQNNNGGLDAANSSEGTGNLGQTGEENKLSNSGGSDGGNSSEGTGNGGQIGEENKQNKNGDFDGAISSEGDGNGSSPASEGRGSNTPQVSTHSP
ncbi:B3 domain-containing protein [Melia azedarach]|uniref:B3 domain-containing protein n=1 Tax=Melia azedarach TaxID=155640 RepID=A0ACC1YLI0_MELAZ|nr:B3 domain-containing protein [Melia azedarach]